MDICTKTEAAINAGETLTTDMLEHQSSCALCSVIGELAPRKTIALENDYEAVAEQIAEDGLSSTRGIASLWQCVLYVSIAVIGVVLVSVLSGRGFEVYEPTRMLTSLGLFLAGLIATIVVAFRPLHKPDTPITQVGALLLLSCAIPVGIALWPGEESFSLSKDIFAASAIPCLSIGVAMGGGFAVIGLIFYKWMRTRLVLYSAMIAAWFGNAILQVHCPVVHPEHLIVGHAGVAILAITLAVATYLVRTR